MQPIKMAPSLIKRPEIYFAKRRSDFELLQSTVIAGIPINTGGNTFRRYGEFEAERQAEANSTLYSCGWVNHRFQVTRAGRRKARQLREMHQK